MTTGTVGSTRTMGAVADAQARLREILADKSTLTGVPLLPRDQWVKREERVHCNFCARKFRTFSRKVHCRSCGEIVCSSCYRKKDVQVGLSPADTLPVRLCLDCIDLALAHPPPPPAFDEDQDGVEGSFTNSGRVTLSACSSHMKFVDGLLVVDPTASKSSEMAATDSFVNLELSAYENCDSDAGDTDRESAYSYDSDGETGMDETAMYYTSDRGGRTSSAKSLSASTTSTVSSSGSTCSGSHRMLGFVPEDESLGDFVSDMKLTMSDLEVDPDTQRSELLRQYNVASLAHQREFNALCELVSRALDCGVAAVGFMGETSQWYKAKIGISQSQLPRDVAFCSQTLDAHSATVVLDATKDPRFRTNPLVTGSAHIRFYASAPIFDPQSQLVLGSVFVMDPQPKKQVSSRAMDVLAYAAQAVQQLVLSEKKTATRRRKRQDRIRRVFSEPALVDGSGDDDDDHDGVVQFTMSDGPRDGGALWTSEPPRSKSFGSGSGVGITLLDPDALLSTLKTSSSSRGSAECETETAKVLGRSAPPRAATTTHTTKNSSVTAEEIRQQIETTQQLLQALGSSRGVRASPGAVVTEVEV